MSATECRRATALSSPRCRTASSVTSGRPHTLEGCSKIEMVRSREQSKWVACLTPCRFGMLRSQPDHGHALDRTIRKRCRQRYAGETPLGGGRPASRQQRADVAAILPARARPDLPSLRGSPLQCPVRCAFRATLTRRCAPPSPTALIFTHKFSMHKDLQWLGRQTLQ
jgi:hypothetical protein